MTDTVVASFAIETDSVYIEMSAVGTMSEESSCALRCMDAYLIKSRRGEGVVGRGWAVGVEAHHGEDGPS